MKNTYSTIHLSLCVLILLSLLSLFDNALAQEVILKIPVTEEGVHQISYNELGYLGKDYGINPREIDPRQIHIYNRDKDVALYVYGEEDGRFDSGDYVEFYGTPVLPDDPEYKYTEENVYWLKVNTAPPVRMTPWASSGSGTAESSFLYSFHAERNWIYWETMPDGIGLDHWFWGHKITAGSKQDYTFPLSSIASTTQKATVRVCLQGKTNDPASPDHQTRISLNGSPLGDVIWEGQKPIIYSFDNVPHSLLKAGPDGNTITFEEIKGPDVFIDSIYVNWVEVDYYKNFVAEGNRLKFTARGNGIMNFSVSNFTSFNIQLFDVTDPYHPRLLTNPSVSPSGGGYTVKFSDTVSGETTYLAIALPEIENSFLFYDKPSSLKNTANGADYLIITHDSLKDAVLPLAEHRDGQGYRVKIVTTREIYDEFSAGIFTPQAIKDFLRYAYENWKGPAPEFVLLIGDANVDYKDNWKTGQINYVPTYLVDTTIVGETPSDHWFVTVAGDDPLPDMFIGRIPAKTVGEVTMVVNKIIGYETGGKYDWGKRVLLAANDEDPRFEEYSEEWRSHLPESYSPTRIYASSYADKSQPRVDLLKDLNDGVLMTSFFGHGGVDLWAASQDAELFTADDAPSLTNQGKLPFVVGFNCLNGLFAEPAEGKWITLPDGSSLLYAVPLPEALLFQDGRGALAMWSPSAFAYPSEQRWIGHELFSGIFEQGNNILGSVTTLAKVNAYVKKGVYVENLDVFTFFGDPATRLAVDIQKNSSGASGSGGGCFIATAAYGSYLHPHVQILRDFRDRLLLQTYWGKRVVDTYYRFSPPAAEWLRKREWVRVIIRMVLLPVVFLAWLAVGASGWTQGGFLMLLPVIILGIYLMREKRLRRYVTFLAIIFSILWTGMSADSTAFASGPDEDLTLIRSDEKGLVVELVLPAFRVIQTAQDGSDYDRVEVMDYGSLRKPGSPEVPMRGTLIAIPEGGDVSLTVTAGEYETRRLRLGSALHENTFYPGPLAARGFTGYMRDQRVMQILFYPVQYNPVTGEARIYKKIRVAVGFDGPAQGLKKAARKDMGTRSESTNSGAYEKLLKGLLLNYSAVR